jgi:hypothetical protein
MTTRVVLQPPTIFTIFTPHLVYDHVYKRNKLNVLPAPRQRNKKGQVLTGWNCELGGKKRWEELKMDEWQVDRGVPGRHGESAPLVK